MSVNRLIEFWLGFIHTNQVGVHVCIGCNCLAFLYQHRLTASTRRVYCLIRSLWTTRRLRALLTRLVLLLRIVRKLT